MNPRRDVTGVVLCGGRGTRMGAVDKGLQPFRGQPLIAAVLARFAPQVGPLLVNANRNLDIYARFATVVTDRHADFPGPLAGIAAALAACETDFLAVVPCDAPFLPIDLVERLARPLVNPAADGPIDVAVARDAVRVHPVFCLIRRSLAAELTRRLARDERRVEAWIAASAHRAVSFDDEAPFRNLNTVADLQAAASQTSGTGP